MQINRKSNKTLSRTSPKGGSRGCLCDDNTYSKNCCDGTLQAQGIGVIQKQNEYLIQENDFLILLESGYKIKTEKLIN